MIPYADFTYFALLLYVVVPTLILGFFGRSGRRWTLLATAVVLFVQYHKLVAVRPYFALREIWIVLGFAAWQWTVARLFADLRSRKRWPFFGAIAASLLPLIVAKLAPMVAPESPVGFVGISYVTFRALDVVFCLRDKVITELGLLDFLAFLFFFPTISSGPIDRYRRFLGEWKKSRTGAEFLRDLDGAVHRLFRGFLYKFIIAALIKRYWLDQAEASAGFGALMSYMYAYSLYLFFDFAGYSAFAIALSYFFGIHTPENFNRPFLARNIREFWNRWHITLSFWFRDHVYMRFLLTARRKQWFATPHTAGIIGYFLSFGLMGLWHGIEPHYIAYGLYQATLLSAFDIFSRWNKARRLWRDGPLWRAAAIAVTFNFVCFGFLIFSGRIGASPLSHRMGAVERADCEEISGWVWDKHKPNAQLNIDLLDGGEYLMTVPAGEFRQDLADGRYGNGRHGFRLEPPPHLKDGRSHALHVRVTGTRKNLSAAPLVITCP